ncbi:MAG TPA: VOC family protein [Clostridiales bacterium]|nr:VOC family protein [Clostridiales bacterium]
MEKDLMGTNVVTQIGILCHDIEKTAQDYADLFGVEKPQISITDTREIAKTEYLGEPTPARTKQAFFNVGPNLTIELLEPDHEPSTWRHDLDTYGEGVHHIAFVINGMKTIVEKFERNGMKEIQKGEWIGGRYSYIDAKDRLKVTLELLEIDN